MGKFEPKKMISYARQDIIQDDIEAVIKVLNSDWLTQGPAVPKFENEVRELVGAGYATSVNSATSALHISCLALGLRKGDKVWTTPISFVASANCALYCGAGIDFVDIDPDTYNMCPEKLEEKLIVAERQGNLPKIVIPVHMCGQSCLMEKIWKLSKKFNFKIIEDASHAIGGKYKNIHIGSCRYSDITVFSFHPVKIITTCEGGMAVTNDAQIAKQLKLLRSHGITSVPEEMKRRSSQEIWNYQQVDLGFNYRMTDIQAALGSSQLKRLGSFILRRHELAERYKELLAEFPIKLPFQHQDCSSSYHLYPIQLQFEYINKNQREIYNEFRVNGIQVNLHYIPIYRQPFYESIGFKNGYCPEAEKYYTKTIVIPLHPGLSNIEQNQVVEVIRKILK